MLVLRALHLDVGALNAGLIELRPGLRQVRLRRCAALIAVAGKLHCTFVGLHRVVEQLLLRIGRAQSKVVQCKLSVQAEASVFQVGIAGLSLLPGRGDTTPHTAPQIDLVIQIDGQGEVAFAIVRERAGEVGLIGRVPHRGDGRPNANGRRFAGTRVTNLRTRGAEVGFRGFQRLVGRVDLEPRAHSIEHRETASTNRP